MYDLFNQPAMPDLERDKGIYKAAISAENSYEGWNDIAYEFLVGHIYGIDEFMTEDIRKASKGIVPEPPSNRAWGSVILQAANKGLIYKIGYRPVKNAKAHATPATLWGVNR